MAKEGKLYSPEGSSRFTSPLLPPALLRLQDQLHYPTGSLQPVLKSESEGRRGLDRFRQSPPSLKDFLPTEDLKLYESAVSPEQHAQLEAKLDRVPRMKKPRDEGFLTPLDFVQTNKTHTENIMERMNQIEAMTGLGDVISFRSLRFLAMPHDVVEGMGTKFDDVQPSEEQTLQEARQKRYEHIAMKQVVIPQLSDLSLRLQLSKLYDRYVVRDPEDLDIQFLKFLDEEDGTIAYAEVMFNRRAIEDPEVADRQMKHLWFTSRSFADRAMFVWGGLPRFGKEREQFLEIFEKDMDVLSQLGFPEIAKTRYQFVKRNVA